MPKKNRRAKRGGQVGVNLEVLAVPVSVLTQNITHTFVDKGFKSFLPQVVSKDVAVRPTSISVQAVAEKPCIVEWEARTGSAQADLEAVLRTRPYCVGLTPEVLKLRVPRSIDPARYADWSVRVGGPCVLTGTVTFSYRDGLSSAGDNAFEQAG